MRAPDESRCTVSLSIWRWWGRGGRGVGEQVETGPRASRVQWGMRLSTGPLLGSGEPRVAVGVAAPLEWSLTVVYRTSCHEDMLCWGLVTSVPGKQPLRPRRVGGTAPWHVEVRGPASRQLSGTRTYPGRRAVGSQGPGRVLPHPPWRLLLILPGGGAGARLRGAAPGSGVGVSGD